MLMRLARFIVSPAAALAGLLALACALSAAAPPATQPAAGSPQARAYWELVRDLADPSMEGRGAGTAGIDKARDYIAAHFMKTGLQPLFLPAPDAGSNARSYLQRFDINAGLNAKTQTLAARDREGKAVALTAGKLTAGKDFSTLGFSGSGTFEAPVVFAGYGAVSAEHKYDSYGKTEVKGKVVVLYRYEPQDDQGRSLWAIEGETLGGWTDAATLTTKVRLAQERGAAAVLLVTPPSKASEKELRSAANTGAGEAAAVPVMHVSLDLFQAMLKQAGKADGAAAARELQKLADAGKDTPLDLPNLVLTGKVEMNAARLVLHNVAGLLPGAGALAGEYIVVGGHYDHLGLGGPGSLGGGRVVHPGADDNASGTAGVMTAAATLAAAVARQAATQPAGAVIDRRGIIFIAFSGEERGLLGSSHFVRRLDQAGLKPEQIAAMINMDMIGRARGDRAMVFGTGSGDQFEALLKGAAAEAGLALSLRPSAGSPSDQMPFYARKIPVLHFFAGMHPDYHRPGDTAEKINADTALKVVRVVEQTALALAQADRRVAYLPPKPGEAGMGPVAGLPRGGAYLGITPEFAGDGKGLGIEDVAPGGPADKAGLKAGDTITRWNDRPLAGVRDLVKSLAAAKPGDKVKLQVHRADKTLEMALELGKRG